MKRLQEKYNTEVAKQLKDELKIANPMAIPKVQKVVVNVGVGKLLQQNPKILDNVMEDIQTITGQKPVKTLAKKSIASFKVREGQVVGVSVTLRGARMYDFLDKLINATFPRIRDFRGYSRKGFDGHGNYSVGLKEQTVFPEMVDHDMNQSFGLEVVITTTAENDEQGYLLLKKFGFPFND